jgi:cell division transport system permease protein
MDPKRPATAAELDRALKMAGVDAVVDDHGFWIGDLKRGADLARLALAGVFLLIALAAAAVVAFATQAGLAAHRDVVEVLHLAGARPGFVSWLFVARFARLAGLAGLIGGGGAAALGAIARLVLAGIGSTPQPWVAWSDLVLMVLAPIAAAAVAAAAAQLAALRMVGRMT